MNYILLEEFAGKCEQLAEEKETEREWLSDFANMVLEEAAKVCDEEARFALAHECIDPMEKTMRRHHAAQAGRDADAIRALKAPNVELTGAAPHGQQTKPQEIEK